MKIECEIKCVRFPLLLSFPFSHSFICVLHPPHPPTHLPWSTVLSAGWRVTCGVYVSVCLTVYSELILTHSINLSYNGSNPTCPLESKRVSACLCFRRVRMSCPNAEYTRAWHMFLYLIVFVSASMHFPAWFVCVCVCLLLLQTRAFKSMLQCFMCSCLV